MGKMYKASKPSYKTPLQKVAKKVKAVNENFKKRVKRAVGMLRDRRYVYVSQTASFNNSGSYFATIFSQTTLGDNTYGERQGDVITPTALKFNWSWATGDPYNVCRLIIFQWKPDDNSFPPTGALNNIVNTTGLGSSAAPLEHLVFDQKNFHILHDQLLATTDSGNNQVRTGRINIYGKKLLKIRYTNGVIAGHNNIYALAITDSAVAPHPQLILSAMLEYDA